MDIMNCDQCHTPIESHAKLKIGIKPFKYLHYHTECYNHLPTHGISQPLALPEEAIRSLALSTLIPGLVLVLLPLLADIFNGGTFNPIRDYANNILIPVLGVITLIFSFMHWREVFKIAKAFRATPGR